MRDDTRRAASWALIPLGTYLAAVVAVLLLPVDYGDLVLVTADWLREDIGLGEFDFGWIEFAANIAMFVPVGVLLTLVLRDRWRGVLLALALSASAELAQVFLPNREPSLSDIIANVAGSAIGAAIASASSSRREHADRQPAGDSRSIE